MVAKLTDVAKLAGVSPTTVSRVINKKGYLSEKTIQKVNEAMRELGYKPNNLARSLQGKSAKLIGLIFPNISNVFYAELIDWNTNSSRMVTRPSSATVNMILRRNANTSKCWKPIR